MPVVERLFYAVCTDDERLPLLSPIDTFHFVAHGVEYLITFKYVGCWFV